MWGQWFWSFLSNMKVGSGNHCIASISKLTTYFAFGSIFHSKIVSAKQ